MNGAMQGANFFSVALCHKVKKFNNKIKYKV